MKEVKTGSIEITVVFTGLAIWLLQATLGETVKEAWKKTKIHKGIIKWVEEERPSKLPEFIKDETKKLDFLSGRATCTDVLMLEDKRQMTIHIDSYEDVEIENITPILDDEIVRRSANAIAQADDS